MSISRQYGLTPATKTIDLMATPAMIALDELVARVTRLEATVAMLVAERGNVTTSVTKPKRDRAAYMRERRRAKKT